MTGTPENVDNSLQGLKGKWGASSGMYHKYVDKLKVGDLIIFVKNKGTTELQRTITCVGIVTTEPTAAHSLSDSDRHSWPNGGVWDFQWDVDVVSSKKPPGDTFNALAAIHTGLDTATCPVWKNVVTDKNGKIVRQLLEKVEEWLTSYFDQSMNLTAAVLPLQASPAASPADDLALVVADDQGEGPNMDAGQPAMDNLASPQAAPQPLLPDLAAPVVGQQPVCPTEASPPASPAPPAASPPDGGHMDIDPSPTSNVTAMKAEFRQAKRARDEAQNNLDDLGRKRQKLSQLDPDLLSYVPVAKITSQMVIEEVQYHIDLADATNRMDTARTALHSDFQAAEAALQAQYQADHMLLVDKYNTSDDDL